MKKSIIITLIALAAVIASIAVFNLCLHLSKRLEVYKFSGYYRELAKKCLSEKDGYNCCIDSVRSMEAGGYQAMPENGCPVGYHADMLQCLGSLQMCVSDKNLTENYEIYIKHKDEPARTIMNEEGPILSYFDDLVIADIKTGEDKVFDFFEDLAHQSVKSYLENISAPTEYYLRVKNLEMSKDKKRFSGSVELYPSADPPMSMKSSYFQITPGSWRIDLNDQPNDRRQ